MRKHPIVFAAIGALAAAGLVVACDDHPVSRLPNRPSPVAFAGIEISGPDRVAPGQSAQFTAIIRLSDGTRKTASADTNVTWTTSDGQLLRVNGSGVATAQQLLGDATVRASVPRGSGGVLQSAKEITILPDGTFRVVGMIRDKDFPTLPIFGARIDVTPGQVATFSGFDGRYTLYGVPSEAEVRITRAGYASSVQSLRLTAHTTQDFELVAAGPRNDPPSGPYTLTVDVTGTCSSLPADLQHRRYDANVTRTGRDGMSLTVSLTEPRFRVDNFGQGNKFTGRVDAGGATFELYGYSSYYYYYYPSVAELLANGSVLEISGRVAMKGSALGLSGQLISWGGITNWDSGFPLRARSLGSCSVFSSTSPIIMLTLVPTLVPR